MVEPDEQRHIRPATDLNLFSDLDRLRLHADASMQEQHFQSFEMSELIHPTLYNVFGWPQ